MPSTGKGRSKKALSKDRMKELFEYWRKTPQKKKYAQEWQNLSLYLFSYLVAGLNLEDIIRLTDKNLHGDKLHFVRKKTTQPVEVPIHKEAAQILADFSSISKGGYLFPYLKSGLSEKEIRLRKLFLLKKVNADLKAIAGTLGIPAFTFYSARHSFANVLHNQNVPTVHIGDLLGHTNEKTTRNYLASIETETKKEAFGKLL